MRKYFHYRAHNSVCEWINASNPVFLYFLQVLLNFLIVPLIWWVIGISNMIFSPIFLKSSGIMLDRGFDGWFARSLIRACGGSYRVWGWRGVRGGLYKSP